jgi:hypothetical protein
MLLVRLCYVPLSFHLLNTTRDIFWNANNAGESSPNPNGVKSYPRALNGYMDRIANNTGVNCINLCLLQNRTFTFVGTQYNQCCTSPSQVLDILADAT